MSAADYPLAPDPRVEWQGAKRRYDLVKEAVIALVAVSLLTVAARARLLLARREAGHDRELGDGRPEGLPRDRAVGARRHERRRDLRAAVHARRRGRPEHHRRALDPAGARRADPDRPRSRLRARPAGDPGPDRPDARAALCSPGIAPRRAARMAWATRYAKAVDQGAGRRASQPEPGRLRARADADGEPARDGAERRPRRRAHLRPSSFYQTNFTKALLFLADGSYLEARAAQQNLLGSQWGMMNETGNFPGPGVALALHLLVPGAAVLDLRERRRADLGDHGHPLARASSCSRSSRASGRSRSGSRSTS